MTTGVDTDYFLPSDREPKNFQRLTAEQREIIELVRVQISESDDFDRMRDAVGNLNDVLFADGLLGQSATLQSESATVVSRGVNYETATLEIEQVLEIVSGEKHQGVFVGCDVVPINNMTPELVFLLELPMVTKDLRFRTAVAAVDDTILMIDASVEGTGESLELLSRVENEIVKRNLRLIGEVRIDDEEVDSKELSEMALLAVEILAQPEVAQSKALTDAVAEIFTGVIDGAARYAFEGFDVRRVERENGVALSINQIEASGYIHAMTTVEDFEYIPAEGDKEANAVISKTLQPAFVVMDGETPYVVPLRYLTLFYVDGFSESASSCQSSRLRFLNDYPDTFDPTLKNKKISGHIVKKYFKNGEGDV